MTFSVSRDKGAFEWAGTNALSVFVQPRNLLNPRVWRMLLDIFRFNLFGLDLIKDDAKKSAKDVQQDEDEADLSIGEYLEKQGFGEGFKEDYLLVSQEEYLELIQGLIWPCCNTAHDCCHVSAWSCFVPFNQ